MALLVGGGRTRLLLPAGLGSSLLRNAAPTHPPPLRTTAVPTTGGDRLTRVRR
ncbi:hypothetical protein GTY92_10920 [Streptomyces sp. SID4950]|nr:hypothetical protein [Streptomyces sp. SID4950]